MVDHDGEPGGTVPDTLVLLEGKAVRVVSMNRFLVSGFSDGAFSRSRSLAKNGFLARSMAVVWRAGFDAASNGWAWMMSPNPVTATTPARTLVHARIPVHAGTLAHATGFHAARFDGSNDWRTRASRSPGGIPPARNRN